MKHLRPQVQLAVTLGLFLSLVAAGPQITVLGRVVGVTDGDTLTVLTTDHHEVRVRLADIDAPESAQAFGKRAKQTLSDLVYDQPVRVVIVDWDRYARAIGQVSKGDVDVNAEMVHLGIAWAYRKYLERPELLDVEREARTGHRGLWADADPVPPWEFRHSRRAASAKAEPEVAGKPAEHRPAPREPVIGNRKSLIYHWPGCPNYDDVSPADRAYFSTRREADAAGYEPARNCP